MRGVRITGGPHETFGDSTVVVRYSGAQNWDRLVAVLAVGTTPITAGGVKLNGREGKVTIKLMNQMLRVPAGKKLDAVPCADVARAEHPRTRSISPAVQPDAKITIGRVTLDLSVLKKAVSR